MVTTRFAPSPTGNLHLGHAYAALFAAEQAKALGGEMLLRMEDIDLQRCKPAFENSILEDLAWLGLNWPEPLMRQSTRQKAYDQALNSLREQGLIYPCFCSRKDIQHELDRLTAAPHSQPLMGPEGAHYPGTCKGLAHTDRSTTREPSWRLDAEKAAAMVGDLYWEDQARGRFKCDPLVLGDFIVARRDLGVAYHLAVVVDDAAQGVDRVTRGEDLLPMTHVHRLLQALLGLPKPKWHHHLLVTDASGRRLAKRDKAETLIHMRESGVTPSLVYEGYLAWRSSFI